MSCMVSKRGRIEIIKLPLVCVTYSFHLWLEKPVPDTGYFSWHELSFSLPFLCVGERGKKSQRHRNEMCSSSLILNARKTGLNFCYLVYFNCSLSGTKVIVGKVGGCFCLSSGPLCVQMKNCSVAAEINSVSRSPFPLTRLSVSQI